MNSKSLTTVAILAGSLVATSCSNIEQIYDKDIIVPVEELPTEVSTAAEREVPGIMILRAEREERDGRFVYDLSGTTEGRRHEIRVDQNGNVFKTNSKTDSEDD